MPDENASLGYTLMDVPVYLKWETTRTTARPVGYVMPPAMAAVLPLLLDHDIAVYRFREATTPQRRGVLCHASEPRRVLPGGIT